MPSRSSRNGRNKKSSNHNTSGHATPSSSSQPSTSSASTSGHGTPLDPSSYSNSPALPPPSHLIALPELETPAAAAEAAMPPPPPQPSDTVAEDDLDVVPNFLPHLIDFGEAPAAALNPYTSSPFVGAEPVEAEYDYHHDYTPEYQSPGESTRHPAVAPSLLSPSPPVPMELEDDRPAVGDAVDMEATYTAYRSPPFMEAPLPPEEESPLPVPPRTLAAGGSKERYYEELPIEGDKTRKARWDEGLGIGVGHVRSPVIPSRSISQGSSTSSSSHHPSSSITALPTLTSRTRGALESSTTTLENLSRTIRTYAPFSPSPKPDPPLVSTPIVHGRRSSQVFGTERDEEKERRRRSVQEFEREYERGESWGYGYGGGGGGGEPAAAAPVLSLPSGASFSTAKKGGGSPPDRQGAWGGASSSPSSHSKPRRKDEPELTRGSALTQTLHSQRLPPPRRSGTADDDAVDKVVWAKWDVGQRLVVGYEKALQVWDAKNLGSVSEVLNLDFGKNGNEWVGERGGVVSAVVGATLVPARSRGGDEVLVILLEVEGVGKKKDVAETLVVVYSLAKDAVLERWSVAGVPQAVQCGGSRAGSLVVVSTSTPPGLHTLSLSPSTGALKTLYTLPSSELALFSTPLLATSSQQHLNAQAPPSPTADGSAARRAEIPHPVFALSHRLLAYAVPSSASASSAKDGAAISSSFSQSSSSSSPSSYGASGTSPLTALANAGLGLGSGVGGIPNTKAELGSAALKVGGSVWGGVRWMGGMAFEGVKRGIASQVQGLNVNEREREDGTVGSSSFSRSAPTREKSALEEAEERKRRRFSDIQRQGGVPGAGEAAANSGGGGKGRGYVVKVVDLGSLLVDGVEGGSPTVVAEFVASRSQPIAKMEFGSDGCLLYVVPRDAYVTKVFKVRPMVSRTSAPPHSPALVGSPKPAGHSPTAVKAGSTGDVYAGSVVLLYELRRGRVTVGVVEGVGVAADARWVGVVTRNRTVHVFATNPGGGRTSVVSHLEGRVRNAGDNTDGSMVELRPLLRVHTTPISNDGSGEGTGRGSNSAPALAFAFVDPSLTTLPGSLVPTSASSRGVLPAPGTSYTSTSSSSFPDTGMNPLSSASSPPAPLSPLRHHGRTAGGSNAVPKNYQDFLLFDSATGVLHLHRITLERKARGGDLTSGMSIVTAAIGGTSRSFGSVGKSLSSGLPGMTSGRSVSSSLSSTSATGGVGATVAPGQSVEDVFELVGRQGVVATWDLKKRKSWEEVRQGLASQTGVDTRAQKGTGSEEWLAQAELSTFSKPRTSRSRSIYLTYQFSFHTLGEDYHALIRKYRLDVDGDKIDVRKEVPIQAFTNSTSDRHTSGRGVGESFIEGFSPTRTTARGSYPPVGGVPSSFDEPLASALSGELDYHPPAAVLPMYPNGIAGASSRTAAGALRNSIPIRRLGDGVSEGLGRITRKGVDMIGQGSRSRRFAGKGTAEEHDVLLEFDEEVDDFMAPRIVASGRDADGLLDDDVVGKVDEEIWESGWDSQDKRAVEEVEEFHTISTAQYIDDGAVPVLAAPIPGVKSSGTTKKHKKRK